MTFQSQNFPKQVLVLPLNPGWKMSAKDSPTDLNCGLQGSGLRLQQRGGSWGIRATELVEHTSFPSPHPVTTIYGAMIPWIITECLLCCSHCAVSERYGDERDRVSCQALDGGGGANVCQQPRELNSLPVRALFPSDPHCETSSFLLHAFPQDPTPTPKSS